MIPIKSIVSQVASQRKIRKGAIQRSNQSIVSHCQALAPTLTIAEQHALGRKLVAYFKKPRTKKKKLTSIDARFKAIGLGDTSSKSQAYFASTGGYKNRKTPGRHTDDLEKLGLLEVEQSYKKNNLYRIGAYLKLDIVRNYLVSIFPSLRLIIGISALMSFNSLFALNVPLLYKKDINNTARLKYKTRKLEHRLEAELQENASMLRYIYLRFVKKDIAMNISPVTEQLTSLKLSTTGKIKLSAFPTQAIELADRKLAAALSKKAVADPFGYLMKVCIEWCKEHSQLPDYKRVNTLMRDFSCNEDDKRFDAVLISEKSLSKQAERYPRYDPRTRQKELEIYHSEQAQWAVMTDAERKEYLRPLVYSQCKAGLAQWVQRFCPFVGSEPFVNQLVTEYNQKQLAITEQEQAWDTLSSNEQQSIWQPLIPHLAGYTPQQRAQYLGKSDCAYAIDTIEQLVASYNAKENNHANHDL